MSLYPTKTRLALLQAVVDGAVFKSSIFPYESYLQGPLLPKLKLTARVREAEAAGWIELSEPTNRWATFWRLTDAGRAVLDGAS